MLKLNYVHDDNDYEDVKREGVPRKRAMLNLKFVHNDNDYEDDKREGVPRKKAMSNLNFDHLPILYTSEFQPFLERISKVTTFAENV